MTCMHEAWTDLKVHFHHYNRASHMQLFSKVLSCRIEPEEPVDMFAAHFQRIADHLAAMKEPIKEIYLTFQLLQWLPKKFDNLVQGTLHWPDDQFKFKNVLTEIVAEESRIKL